MSGRIFLVLGVALGLGGLGCGGGSPASPPDSAANDAGLDGGDAQNGTHDGTHDGAHEGTEARSCAGYSFNCFNGSDCVVSATCEDGAWKCPAGYSTENGTGCGPPPPGPLCDCNNGLWNCPGVLPPVDGGG